MTQLANTSPTLRLNWPKTTVILTGWAGGTLRKGHTVSATGQGLTGSALVQDGGYFEIAMSGNFNIKAVDQAITVTGTDSDGRIVTISTSAAGRPYVTDGSPAAAV